jgi:hypothetical protein
MSKVVAIHQPNFLPWLGFFDKIARADVFVFMDNVQFPKKGGTWTNRVKLLVSGKENWITAPIDRRYHGVRMINEMKLNNEIPWRDKILKTIQTNYSKAPFYNEIYPHLFNLINNPTDNLSEYNIKAIYTFSRSIGLDVSKMVFGSSLEVGGNATDLIISIVRAVEGTSYMAGGGADGYQEDEKFADADIELIYQNFQHPVYAQFNSTEFVPGLSIVDALMNLGPKGVRDLMLSE